MSWLALLKNQTPPDADATKPTKPQEDVLGGRFVGSVAHPHAQIQSITPLKAAVDDISAEALVTNLDRYCWPKSDAMNGQEIETFMVRMAMFTDKGLTQNEAERLADNLVIRDREFDDRRLCLECAYLQGHGHWRCGNRLFATVSHNGVANDLVVTLQRCSGYASATTTGR